MAESQTAPEAGRGESRARPKSALRMTASAVAEDAMGAQAPVANVRTSPTGRPLTVTSVMLAAPSGSGHPNQKVN